MASRADKFWLGIVACWVLVACGYLAYRLFEWLLAFWPWGRH